MAKNKLENIRKYNKIFSNIIQLIENSKHQAISQVNQILIKSYFEIGHELSLNSSYGKSIVEKLSLDLKLKYPNIKGYSVRNLWNMKKFYETYSKLQPVVAELIYNVSWTNHITILNYTNSFEEKEFYLNMCIKERWSKRELKRQIDVSLFERFISVDKPKKVLELIPKNKETDITKHFKDEYFLEFLELKDSYSEKELEESTLNNLRDFFLEFGKSLAFLGSQYIIDIGGKEHKIDLLFFHRELRCLVAIELKIGSFKAAYVGQMQKYLAALDEKVRLPDELESIGLILCKSKNKEEVKFALAKTTSTLKVATYQTKLPNKEMIIKRLEQFKMKSNKA